MRTHHFVSMTYALSLVGLIPAVMAQQIRPEVVKVKLADQSQPATSKADIVPDVSACHVPGGERLTAEISAEISRQRMPGKVELRRSTGDSCLDRAALGAVSHAEFYPAVKGDKQVDQRVSLLIDFGGKTAAELKASGIPIMPPRLLRQARLSFGDCVVAKNREYHARVSVGIDVHGVPTRVSIVSTTGDACLDRMAERSAREYLFKPAQQEGLPVPSNMQIEMQFNN